MSRHDDAGEDPLAAFSNAPKRFLCVIGREWKPANAFSKRQLAGVQFKLMKGLRVDPANCGVKCSEHSGKAREEMTCRGPCNRILSIKDFSKTARRSTEWCMQCVAWKELQHKEVLPWAIAHHQLTADEEIIISHIPQPQENDIPAAAGDSASVLAQNEPGMLTMEALQANTAAVSANSTAFNLASLGNALTPSVSGSGSAINETSATAFPSTITKATSDAGSVATTRSSKPKYVPPHLRSAAASAATNVPSSTVTPNERFSAWATAPPAVMASQYGTATSQAPPSVSLLDTDVGFDQASQHSRVPSQVGTVYTLSTGAVMEQGPWGAISRVSQQPARSYAASVQTTTTVDPPQSVSSSSVAKKPSTKAWAKSNRVPMALNMPVGGYMFQEAVYDATGNDDESDDGFE